VRDNSLALFFLAIFLMALLGQAIAGHALYNEEQVAHGEHTISFVSFVSSSRFVVEVAENWQSEFLQFTLYVLATIWLVQRGSSESKEPGHEGLGSDEEQLLGEHARPDSPASARAGGLRTRIYSWSLTTVMAVVFLASWGAQSLAGVNDFNEEQAAHGEQQISWLSYLGSADFWDRTLQNWQSEFLAVGTMAIFAVFLRQRGSPESKPVGMPHHTTTSEE
jgi:membrane protein implicated in regulation of membrane protease activity